VRLSICEVPFPGSHGEPALWGTRNSAGQEGTASGRRPAAAGRRPRPPPAVTRSLLTFRSKNWLSSPYLACTGATRLQAAAHWEGRGRKAATVCEPHSRGSMGVGWLPRPSRPSRRPSDSPMCRSLGGNAAGSGAGGHDGLAANGDLGRQSGGHPDWSGGAEPRDREGMNAAAGRNQS
jgi:hypothetical protein